MMKKFLSRCFIIIAAFVFISDLYANPVYVPPSYFSELAFDSSGWKLEFHCQDILIYDSISLNGWFMVSGKDTAYFKDGFYIDSNYLLITKNDLNGELNLNPMWDTVMLFSASGMLKDSLLYDSMSGLQLHPGSSSQSISRFNFLDVSEYSSYCFYRYYIDNSSTLGFENDTIDATGIIYGYVYDVENKPAANQIIYLNSNAPYMNNRESAAFTTNSTGYFIFNTTPAFSNYLFVRKGFNLNDTTVTVNPNQSSYIELRLDWLTETENEIDTIISPQGWITQQPPANVSELYDVYAVNNNLAFAIGRDCKIIKTTNGGENWDLVYSNSSLGSNNGSIFFADSLFGWGVFGNFILKTEDCGKNWNIYDTKKMYGVNQIFFIDKDTGWVVGTYGTCLKTTDGGIKWEDKNIPSHYNYFTDIQFINSKIGYITGIYGSWAIAKFGVFLSTSDGGDTWKMNETDDLYSISFINSDTGWIFGRNGQKSFLYKTNNGGILWDDIIIENYNFKSINFINNYEGWALNEYGYDNIYYTTDGGKTWNKQGINETYHIKSIFFTSEKTGWAVGKSSDSKGVILKSSNGLVDNVHRSDDEPVVCYSLSQNYPNPFNPATNIGFQIADFGLVSLKVYDVLGREVTTLVNKERSPGNYKVEFDANGLPSGIYFYKLQVSNSSGIKGFTEVKKMMVLK